MLLLDCLLNISTISKGHRRTQAALDEWFETTTIDDVYKQFLSTAMSPCMDRQCVPQNLLRPSDIGSFDAIVSTFPQAANGEIRPSDVFRFLGQAHPSQALLIHSIEPCLTSLLFAHARFPFPNPVTLNRDALLRTVMLLTHRGTKFFEKWTLEHAPGRTDHDRLAYIFWSLAIPASKGLVQYRDIVEVLVRLPFPLPSLPDLSPWRSRRYFQAMAERLDPPSRTNSNRLDPPSRTNSNRLDEMSEDNFGALTELAAGFTDSSEKEDKVMKEFLASTTKESLGQFIAWGFQAQLLEALDKFFEPLLQPQ